jgi:hypothetical protein
MLPQWTHHLKDPEEKKRFRSYIYNSRTILDRQLDILKGWEAELDNQETDVSAYETPSWAARQADNNGYRRCLKKMKHLLTLDQKEI